MILIENRAINAPEKTDNYEENIMWAGQAYEDIYRQFRGDIARSQKLLPLIAKYYGVKRSEVVKEWCEQYAILRI